MTVLKEPSLSIKKLSIILPSMFTLRNLLRHFVTSTKGKLKGARTSLSLTSCRGAIELVGLPATDDDGVTRLETTSHSCYLI